MVFPKKKIGSRNVFVEFTGRAASFSERLFTSPRFHFFFQEFVSGSRTRSKKKSQD